jgi:hypothetical protein
MDEDGMMNPQEAMRLLAETFREAATHASDMAYARRTMYLAYLSEGFTPQEALELCKIL